MVGTRHPGRPGRAAADGRAAEARVAAFLEAQGYIVLARNLHVGRDEIDLVALDGAVLVAVEVRARRAGALVHPFESITAAKKHRLRRAVARLAAERGVVAVRIDVAAVTAGAIEYVENAIDFSEA